MDLVIRRATLAGREGQGSFDIGIKDGIIAAIEPNLPGPGNRELPAEGRLVSMGFIDAHVHIDKCLIEERLPEPAVFETLRERVDNSRRLKGTFTVDDVYARAKKALELSVLHGTTTVRTNVEADPIVEMRAVEGVLRARAAMAPYIDVQTVAFPQEGWGSHEPLELDSRPYIEEALRMGIDVVGGNVNASLWVSDARRQVDDLFALAERWDKDIDLHLDNADNGVAFTLPYLLDKIERHGFQGRVIGGHVVGLAHVPENIARRTIERVRELDMTICVLPIRIRLTPVAELLAAGVNVICATDNMQDAFTGMGTANMLQAMNLLAHVTRRTRKQHLEEIFEMGTTRAAAALGLDNELGLEVGRRADLVVLECDSRAEAVRAVARPRWVIKRGHVVVEGGRLLPRAA